MNINPAAAASVAGTSRAARSGGESDNQATEATRQKSAADAPGGKTGEAAIDAGDSTQDRGGDGRQVLDVFQLEEKNEEQESDQEPKQTKSVSPEGSGEHLDLDA